MIITIELQNPEEMDWLRPLLLELQRKQAKIRIGQSVQATGGPNKEDLINALRAAGELGTFARIQDPVAWQEQLRDEWEH